MAALRARRTELTAFCAAGGREYLSSGLDMVPRRLVRVEWRLRVQGNKEIEWKVR